MGDTMRDGFEAWARPGSGRLRPGRWDDNGEYKDSSLEEQWRAWQAAHEAGRQLGMEQARREPLTDAQVDDIVIKAAQQWAAQTSPHPSKPVITARLVEAAHGINPTQQAGDSDTP